MENLPDAIFDEQTLRVGLRTDKKEPQWYAYLRYRLPDGFDSDGNPKYRHCRTSHPIPKTVTTRKGAKAAANQWLADLKDEQKAAQAIVAQRKAEEARKAEEERLAAERANAKTLHQYLLEYLDTRSGLEPSTFLDLRSSLKRVIKTTDDMPLEEFSEDMAQDWKKELGSKYAFNTCKKTYNAFNAAMTAAVKSRLIAFNPLGVVSIDDAEKRSRKFVYKSKDNYLDKENRTILLSDLGRMEDCPTKVAALIAIYTGLRRAEICALTWRDIDFDSNLLYVRHSVGIADGGMYIKFPKSVSSERVVSISPERYPEVRAALASWKASQKAVYRKAMGDSVPAFSIEDTFALGNPTVYAQPEFFPHRTFDGDLAIVAPATKKAEGFLNPNTLEREWAAFTKFSKARGVLGKRPTFHNLRHTFASYCANESNVPVETLAQVMGHSNTSTTQRYYVAKDKKAQIRNAQEVAKLVAESGAVRKDETRGEVVSYPSATGTEGR